MHKSRIGAICIDVPAERREAAETFWSGALGQATRRGERHPEYSTFGVVHQHVLLIQAIGAGEPRVHLDVHTDNVSAEVARLAALGATEIDGLDGWVVMRDPGGSVFCVVPCDADDATMTDAATWP
jgi:hypothetical protein